MFDGECLCDGPVEQWLNSVVDAMKQALFAEYQRAIPAYDNMKRASEWIYEFSAQNTIVVSRTFFTQEVNEAFEELEEGNEDALKVWNCQFLYTNLDTDDPRQSARQLNLSALTCGGLQGEWEKQKSQLADLVAEINKPLKSLDRATLITLCTIDVHARDVLGRLIDERVEDVTCFQWQSQLRYVVHEKTKKCQVQLFSAHAACYVKQRMNVHKLGYTSTEAPKFGLIVHATPVLAWVQSCEWLLPCRITQGLSAGQHL